MTASPIESHDPRAPLAPLGMMHGRFQPFHLGHHEYLRLALARCDLLLIGITNPDPYQIAEEELAQHRHRADANPYTFFERLMMIRETLIDDGVPPDRTVLIPFPINLPDRWRHYIPPDVTHFVRVFSEWEQSKVDRLRDAGYATEVLTPGADKQYEATEVRRRIAAGEDWQSLVPPGVAGVISGLPPREQA